MIPLSKALATWVRREPGSQRARRAVALTVPDQLHSLGREFPQQPRVPAPRVILICEYVYCVHSKL